MKLKLIYSFLYSQIYLRLFGVRIGAKSFIVLPIGLIRNPKGLSIGDHSRILYNSRIDLLTSWQGRKFSPLVFIGNNVNIGQNLFLSCVNLIKIDDGVLVSDNVAFVDNDHVHIMGMSASKTALEYNEIIIEKNVTIYRNCTILSGTVLGENSVVAANSVVRGVFPSNVLVGGVPAKILKYYD